MTDWILKIGSGEHCRALYLADDFGLPNQWQWTNNLKKAKRFSKERAMDISVEAWSIGEFRSIEILEIKKLES